MVAPVLEEIAGEREDLRIVKLNVDDNQQTAAAYQVMSIPTLILFNNGQVATKIIGAKRKRSSSPRSSPRWRRRPPAAGPPQRTPRPGATRPAS
jgi:thioredoxin 1